MTRKNEIKTCWFTTKEGGQLGVNPQNIKKLTSTHISLRNGHVYELDVTKWNNHKTILVDHILGV